MRKATMDRRSKSKPYVLGKNPTIFGTRSQMLGSGSYGSVWLYGIERYESGGCMGPRVAAIDPIWAIKETPPAGSHDDAVVQETALKEIAIARNVGPHVNLIIPESVAIDDSGRTFSAMPIALATLWQATRAWWQSNPWMSGPAIASCVDDVLKGLAALHDAGISHLDVSPSNVLLRMHPGDQPWMALASPRTRFAIADLGFASTPFSRHTGESWCVYQGAFRSPENIAATEVEADRYVGEARDGARSDVWAVGAIAAYLMIGGTMPKLAWLSEGRALDARFDEHAPEYPIDESAALLAKIEIFLGKRAMSLDGVTRKLDEMLTSGEYSWRMSERIVARAAAIPARVGYRAEMGGRTAIGVLVAGPDAIMRHPIAELTVRMLDIDPRCRPSARDALADIAAMRSGTARIPEPECDRAAFVNRMLDAADASPMRRAPFVPAALVATETIEREFVRMETGARSNVVSTLKTIELARMYGGAFPIGACGGADCESCIAHAATACATSMALAAAIVHDERMSCKVTAWLATHCKSRIPTTRSCSGHRPDTWSTSRIIADGAAAARGLDMDLDRATPSSVAECIICGGEALREIQGPKSSGVLSIACSLVGFAIAISGARDCARPSTVGLYVAEVATRGQVMAHYRATSPGPSAVTPSSDCGSPQSARRISEARAAVVRVASAMTMSPADRDAIEGLSRAAAEALGRHVVDAGGRPTTISAALDSIGWNDRQIINVALAPPWMS
jgi:serine/threonine protein kinase